LNGSVAKLIGTPNEGVRTIATILNITRIHNATAAVSSMRRSIAIARDYAFRRQVFGTELANNLLHLQTIADLEIEYRAALQFLFDVIKLLGLTECGKASPEDHSKLMSADTIYSAVLLILILYHYFFDSSLVTHFDSIIEIIHCKTSNRNRF
jgi:alkylation response protein AidB-like acyl-CoA dehydrogenase